MCIRDRVDRLGEFVELLDRLLTHPVTSWQGSYYEAVEARMRPGCVQAPRLPFVVAAGGPRSLRIAARFGQGWATTGNESGADVPWWDGVAALSRRMDDVLAETGRDPGSLRRYLSVDGGGYALSSAGAFVVAVGRARELGFTDVVTHWPRAEGVYAGDESVLERVAADLDSLR